ncbi:protein, SNF2 family [Aggregatibacter actinomycetemcomitans NUM4039]|nr:protein, SNF2 family [Aggregatibacter actinomycetemcomitans NUM4039]
MIDERVFGDLDSFRTQFGAKATEQTLLHLRQRLSAVCQRTLRRQVQAYVPYTKRLAIVQKFTPSEQEREFSFWLPNICAVRICKPYPKGSGS